MSDYNPYQSYILLKGMAQKLKPPFRLLSFGQPGDPRSHVKFSVEMQMQKQGTVFDAMRRFREKYPEGHWEVVLADKREHVAVVDTDAADKALKYLSSRKQEEKVELLKV